MIKKLFLTWVTHNSRYNEKMKSLKIEKSEGYFFDDTDRVIIYNLIDQKLRYEGISDFTLNVLSDHIHLVITYEENDISEFIRKLKGSVSFKYSRGKNFGHKGEGRQNKIWARGYSTTYLDTRDYYEKAIKYTLENHKKHEITSVYHLVNRGL